MVCTACGIVGADARPNRKEQPPRESLTGAMARLTKEQRRALRIRARHLDGCAEAVLSAEGFSVGQMAELALKGPSRTPAGRHRQGQGCWRLQGAADTNRGLAGARIESAGHATS
jgi:hypothetical protein